MKKVIFLLPLLLFSCGEDENVDETIAVVQDIDSLLVQYPDSIELLIQRGNDRFEEGDFSTAMADGAKAYRLDSSNYEAELLYAEAMNNKSTRTVADIAEAQKHYHKLVIKNPKDTRAWVGLASTYRQQQDEESMFKYVNEALRIDPRCRDAYVLKGSAYLNMGNVELAKSSYATAIQQDPDFFAAYIALGWLYHSEGDEVSMEYFQTAMDLKPESHEAKYALAFAMQEYDELEDARKLYRELAMDTSDYYVNRALFHQGYIFQFQDKNIDSAIYFYSSALRTDPTHVESWWNLGLCYSERNESSPALKAYSNAIKYAKQKNYEEEFIEKIRKDAKEENDDFQF